MQTWLLPEYIEDVLPAQAARLEALRRLLLDRCQGYGYRLVQPPLVEYLDSLVMPGAPDLNLKTFKLVDRLSGRTLGVRADITPQVARIDAHLLNHGGVTRLCYAGSVVHTVPDSLLATREPLQLGAEIYGHAGLEADLEALSLMADCLQAVGLEPVTVNVGHAGLLQVLIEDAGQSAAWAQELRAAMQAKDLTTIRQLATVLPEALQTVLLQLPGWYGGPEVLDRARAGLQAWPAAQRVLDDLATVMAQPLNGVAAVTVDLAEVIGGAYHNGLVFAAYAGGRADAVARGGRYDGLGAHFGRARPATGFSLDLRPLLDRGAAPPGPPGVLACWQADPAWAAAVRALRAAGEVVVVALPGQGDDRGGVVCDRRLICEAQAWVVVPMDVD